MVYFIEELLTSQGFLWKIIIATIPYLPYIYIVFAVICGFAAMNIAEKKGNAVGVVFILSLLSPIIGMLYAGFMPPGRGGEKNIVVEIGKDKNQAQ